MYSLDNKGVEKFWQVTGYIQKEIRNGKYQLTVCCGYDVNNKKIRQTKTIQINPNLTEKKKEKILEKECVLFEEEVKAGVVGKDDIRFIDFVLKEWKPNYGDKNLEITTLTRYMEFFNSRIFPAIRSSEVKRYYSTSVNEVL